MSEETAPKSVFVISVIGTPGTESYQKSLNTLKYVINKALPAPEWDVRRADLETSPDSITMAVIRRIHDADLIIADLTDHNPNVFYELAVAHGFGKDTIHLLERGQTMPFDVADQRAIFYDLTDPESVDDAVTRLSTFAAILQDSEEPQQNPISRLRQFKAIESAPSTEDGGKEVALALERLGDRVAGLEKSLRDRAAAVPTFDVWSSPMRSLAKTSLNTLYANGSIPGVVRVTPDSPDEN